MEKTVTCDNLMVVEDEVGDVIIVIITLWWFPLLGK